MVDLASGPTVQPEGLPGRPWPRFPDDVSPQSYGAGVGQAIEGAGAQAQRITDQVMNQARQTQLTDAHNQFQTLSLGLTHDPKTGAFTREGKDAFGITPQYLSQYDQQSQQILDKVPDPRARQAAQLASAQVRNQLAEQLETHELSQHQKFGVDTAKASVDIAQQAMASNYNHPDILATNLDHIDASLESLSRQQGWSEEQLQETKANAHEQAHVGVLDHMLADNKTDLARAYLDHYKGELGNKYPELDHVIETQEAALQANGVVDTYRQGGVTAGAKAYQGIDSLPVSDQQKELIRTKIDSGLSVWRQEQQQKYSGQIEGVEERIASGHPETNDRGAIWSLYRNGAYTAEQTGSLIGRLEKAQEEQAQDDALHKSVLDAYQTGSALDGKDKDTRQAVDDLFTSYTKGLQPGSQTWTNRAADIAAKTGVVPDSLVNWSRTQLIGGDPPQAASAAQAIMRAEEASPRALALDEKTRAMAASITTATQAGADPVKAVEVARQNASLPQAEAKALDEQFKKLRPAMNATGKANTDLQNAFKEVPGAATGLIFKSVPDIPPLMSTQYQGLLSSYYRYTGGDMAAASKLAIADVKHEWGVSGVNGKREFMQWAPESQGFDTQTIRDEVESSVKGLVADPKSVHLVPSAVTENSGGRRFNIAAPDKFGAYDIVRGANGSPRVYELPDGQQAFEEKRQRLAAAGIAKARAEQAASRDREQFLRGVLNEEDQATGKL